MKHWNQISTFLRSVPCKKNIRAISFFCLLLPTYAVFKDKRHCYFEVIKKSRIIYCPLVLSFATLIFSTVYRLMIFRKLLLFTISSKNMTDFYTQRYCHLELPFKFFDKMVSKRVINFIHWISIFTFLQLVTWTRPPRPPLLSWFDAYLITIKSTGRCRQIFVAILENLNFTYFYFIFAACDRQWIIGVKNSAPERGHWGRHCPGFTTGNKQSPIIPQGPIKSHTERKRYPTFEVRHIFIFPFSPLFLRTCPWLRFDFHEIMKVGMTFEEFIRKDELCLKVNDVWNKYPPCSLLYCDREYEQTSRLQTNCSSNFWLDTQTT